MKESDICYYASDEDEDFFDFSVEQPSQFHKDLWSSSATLGLLSLRLAGIELPDEEAMVEQGGRKLSVQSTHSFKNSEILADRETDLHVAADICNWEQDIKRGLQLLRYHANQDSQAKPSVKLNVVPKFSSEEEDPIDSPVVHQQARPSEPELEVVIEKSPSSKRKESSLEVPHPQRMALFKAMRRSISHEPPRSKDVSHRKSSYQLTIPETGWCGCG